MTRSGEPPCRVTTPRGMPAGLPCGFAGPGELTLPAGAGTAALHPSRLPPLLNIPNVPAARLAGSPIVFLRSLAFINYLGFAGWSALLYNFTVEQANFQWFETGLTQSVREIPGFLAFTAIFWLVLVREQVLAYVALAVMGLGVALTGQFPSLGGVLITTFLMSVGFHYFVALKVLLQLTLHTTA